MRPILLLLWILQLLGCGATERTSFKKLSNINTVISPELKPIVDQFYRDCPKAKRGRIARIQWRELEETRLGTCYWFDSKIEGYNDVFINLKLRDSEWVQENPILLKIVVYHEMGHCALNMYNHTETGLMKATLDIWNPTYYEENEQQLITGMCGQ